MMNKVVLFLFAMLAATVIGADPAGSGLPDFNPGEFRTLACEDIVKNFKQANDIPYSDEKAAKADPYIAERCKLDIFYPTHRKNVPLLIFFHGGGMSGGSKDSKMEFYKHLGCVIVTPNYRHYEVPGTDHGSIRDAAYAFLLQFIRETVKK